MKKQKEKKERKKIRNGSAGFSSDFNFVAFGRSNECMRRD